MKIMDIQIVIIIEQNEALAERFSHIAYQYSSFFESDEFNRRNDEMRNRVV